MHIPKRYFHDRLVLLLLTVNTFLALVGSIAILFRLDADRAGGYIVEYRSQLGLSAFKSGTTSELVGFVLFLMIVLVLHSLLSIRVYGIRRHFATAILALGTLLLALGVIVSNALLVL